MRKIHRLFWLAMLFGGLVIPQMASDRARLRDILLQVEKLLGSSDYELIQGLTTEGLDLMLKLKLPDTPEARQLSLLLKSELGRALVDTRQGDREANLAKATDIYRSLLASLDKQRNRVNWVAMELNLATALQFRKLPSLEANLKEAQQHAEDALALVTVENEPQRWAQANELIGMIYSQMETGDRATAIDKAIGAYQRAQTVSPQTRGVLTWAQTEHNLGQLYIENIRGDHQANIEQSISHLNRALELRKDLVASRVKTKLALSRAFRDRLKDSVEENREVALRYAQDASTDANTAHDRALVAQANDQLCTVYMGRLKGGLSDNGEVAVTHCKAAVANAQKSDSPRFWAQARLDLAGAYLKRMSGTRLEDVVPAMTALAEINEGLSPKEYPIEWARSHMMVAHLQLHYGKASRTEVLNAAVRHFTEALDALKSVDYPIAECEVRDGLATALSELQRRTGDGAAKAILLLTENRKFYTPRAYPLEWQGTTGSLIVAHLRNANPDLDEAERLALDALHPPDGPLPDERRLASIRGLLGAIEGARGRWKKASEYYEQAIALVQQFYLSEELEFGRKAFSDRLSTLRSGHAECLLELGRHSEAFFELEAGRAQSMGEVLGWRRLIERDAPADKRAMLQADWDEIRRLQMPMRLPDGSPDVPPTIELASQLRAAKARLQRDAAGVVRAPIQDAEAFRRSIPPGGALIVLFEAGNRFGAFVIPAASRQITRQHLLFPLPMSLKQIDSVTNSRWLPALYNFRTENTPETIAAWRRTLESTLGEMATGTMDPIQAKLREFKVPSGARVVIVPDGRLAFLPWHAAAVKAAGSTSLLDNYSVTISPSLAALRANAEDLKAAAAARKSLVAFVNPTSDLDYSQSEGRAVAQWFPAALRKVIEGQRVDKKTWIASSSRASYLHYAGHASFTSWNPMNSGLELAGGERLTLSEIVSQVRLNGTRLVVLSACDTGLNDAFESVNDALGFPAGFLQAGAAGVLATLWPVNDRSTTLLIARFYELHLGGGKTPGDALKEAQLWIRAATRADVEKYWKAIPGNASSQITWNNSVGEKPFAHPDYWAGFVLYGM